MASAAILRFGQFRGPAPTPRLSGRSAADAPDVTADRQPSRARDDADTRLSVELLPAGNPRRSHRARSGHLVELVLRRVCASLVISRLLGPRVGREINRVGGQQVLCVSNLLLAGGLALLGASTSLWMMVAAWLLLGIGMGYWSAGL